MITPDVYATEYSVYKNPNDWKLLGEFKPENDTELVGAASTNLLKIPNDITIHELKIFGKLSITQTKVSSGSYTHKISIPVRKLSNGSYSDVTIVQHSYSKNYDNLIMNVVADLEFLGDGFIKCLSRFNTSVPGSVSLASQGDVAYEIKPKTGYEYIKYNSDNGITGIKKYTDSHLLFYYR